jgi:hypothetical protein
MGAGAGAGKCAVLVTALIVFDLTDYFVFLQLTNDADCFTNDKSDVGASDQPLGKTTIKGRTCDMDKRVWCFCAARFVDAAMCGPRRACEKQPQLPGCDHEPSKLLLQRRAGAPLLPAKPQAPCDHGLFGDEHLQTDLVDAARRAKP